MTLSPCIEEYVRHRRSLGVCFHGEQVRLRAFLKSVGDLALPAISAESVRRYIDRKGPVTQAWFARFLHRRGVLSVRHRAAVRGSCAAAAAATEAARGVPPVHLPRAS